MAELAAAQPSTFNGEYKRISNRRMKIRTNFFCIVLAMQIGVHSVLAQVTNLGIALAGSQSIIYWPTSSTTNYVLQTKANLSSTNWVTVTNAVAVNAVTITNSVPSGYFRLLQSTNPPGMVLIPAGSFTMGNYLVTNDYSMATNDPDITDANPTNVYVSAFYMDRNLVSSNQWVAVYTYATNHDYAFALSAGSAKEGDNPGNVDWYDCVKWCNARSQQAGLTPVYYTDAGMTQVFMNGNFPATVNANWGANGYRLPTEAEWEKAARGGLTGNRFPWGNFISEGQANYSGLTNSYDFGPYGLNAIGRIGYNNGLTGATTPVGYFTPNGYGLYDMTGNVSEWCWDWYAAPPYPTGSPYLGGANPTGAATGGSRVLRGGSWSDVVAGNYAGPLRCAYRYQNFPFAFNLKYGFRCVKGF
jgi:formylglycine-generating enzyme